ncbi:MAG: hypothetical protein ACYTGP_02115 [Planctomycetota bacterium]|jgi:hypothetical protein
MFRRRVIIDGVRLDRAEAKRVVADAYALARRTRPGRMWFVFVPLFVVAIPAGWFFGGSALNLPLSPLVAGGLFGGVMGLGFATWINYGFRLVYRREIRTAMNQLGYRICPGCGYWLKGLPTADARCPECGTDPSECA